MWRHNDVIGRDEYLISTWSESAVPYVYSLQFLFKSTHHSWRYGRKCEWVFFSEHSVYILSRAKNFSVCKSSAAWDLVKRPRTVFYIKRSHGSVTVWECCKYDRQSQWEMAKFDPQPTLNPWTDRHQIWNTWLCRVYLLSKNWAQSTQKVLPPYTRNIHPKPLNVYFTFSVLPSPHRRSRPLDRFSRLIRHTTGWAKKTKSHTFVYIFAKCWPIFKIFFHRNILWKICNKLVTKYTTTP